MHINIVDSPEDLLKPGDVYPYLNTELGYMQLMTVCPGCGGVSASAGKHRWYPNTKSYSPSIVHDRKLGGCGWHGWITSGIISAC